MLYIICILVTLLFVVILIFNSLVQKRNAADFAFSCIDAQLKKRFDLIPNLVAVVRGYVIGIVDDLDLNTRLWSKE